MLTIKKGTSPDPKDINAAAWWPEIPPRLLMLPKASIVSPEILEIRVEAFDCLALSREMLPKPSIVSKCCYFVVKSDDRQRPGEQEKNQIEKNATVFA